MMIDTFIKQHHLPASFKISAQEHFISLAEQIFSLATQEKKTLFIGVNGCQGSGKSTLTAFITHYLTKQYSLAVVNLSLDDFYLSRNQRQTLAKSIHPLLVTRGVPGTHNIELLSKTLANLKAGNPTLLPRFNKSTDDIEPKNNWIDSPDVVDVVLLEGWCWGVSAQKGHDLTEPINELEQYKDATNHWRNYVNQQLANQYQPLYQYMDKWLMLQAPSFECVFNWRWQQEELLASSLKSKNNRVMSEAEIYDFIQYFQRITEHALTTFGQHADLVFKLNLQREIYQSIGKFI